MYLPYLRGKQFELLALREFSSKHPNCEKICPIIEPVKLSTKNLENAFKILWDNRIMFAVILNPTDGDFKHITVKNNILELCPSLLDPDHNGAWIPAYNISGDNAGDITIEIDRHNLQNVMLILDQQSDINIESVMNLIQANSVSYIVISNASRSTRKKLNELRKNIISLEDRFNAKPKNADYQNPDDEFFSDDVFFYENIDRLWGFADYTIIGKNFVEGGMLPYAIAIHLTYKRNEEELNIHHFVSDNNYDQTNIRGKFIEAAKKIAPFYEENNIEKTFAVEELIERAKSEDKYPGLGYLKKLSILNHLELINKTLNPL